MIAMTRSTPSVQLTNDISLPLTGFGTWQLSGEHGYAAIRTALDLGYRHIDTATVYRNEAEVGRAVRDSGLRREDVFVTTKLPSDRVGQERETLEASLRLLGLDYVDLWLIHWPPAGPDVPTWEKFIELRDAGLTRTVGVSNYEVGAIDRLIAATGHAPVVDQIPWYPSRHNPAELDAIRSRGTVVEGYSPLKGTDLRNRVLVEIARQHGVTPAQVVLRWHIEHEIPVIPRSSNPERIAENFDVFGFTLDANEVASIDALSTATP